MREIHVDTITNVVEALCIKANRILPCSVEKSIESAAGKEESPLGRKILKDLSRNMAAAKELQIPVCQDTGMAVIFVEVGQEVHFTGGLLEDAIQQGVRSGYINGLLRCSVVGDPMKRINTNDNTPAVIHTKLTVGNQVKIMVSPKGFGSENMSAIRMFTPSVSRQDVIDFVVETVSNAGSNPCPPVIVGVGIGGDFEKSAILAKAALCRDIDIPNSTDYYKELEQDMLYQINGLGIGSQGFGGTVTALAVNVEQYATHIAGLPVAVNMGCHVTRHAECVI